MIASLGILDLRIGDRITPDVFLAVPNDAKPPTHAPSDGESRAATKGFQRPEKIRVNDAAV